MPATSSVPSVCDCGHPPTPQRAGAGGTGYATHSETGKTSCYSCAEASERADFRACETGDRWFAYLKSDRRTVTTWTCATLARVVRTWETREGFGGKTLRLWARDEWGRWWGGRGPAEWGTYVRLRLLKRDPR